MNIFIDESGNLGKSGKYFVIAALIPYDARARKRIKNLIKNGCVSYAEEGEVLDEIKGKNLTVEQLQNLMNNFTRNKDFDCGYIIAEKEHLIEKFKQDKNLCFNYLLKILLKPIFENIKEDVIVIVDNRTIKVGSVNSLEDYIRLTAFTEWGFEHKIDFEYCDSKEVKCLQAVDVISNSVYSKYTYQQPAIYNMFSDFIKYRQHFPFKKFGK